MTDTHLIEVDLIEAHFIKTHLIETHLMKIDLIDTHLIDRHLIDTRFAFCMMGDSDDEYDRRRGRDKFRRERNDYQERNSGNRREDWQDRFK